MRGSDPVCETMYPQFWKILSNVPDAMLILHQTFSFFFIFRQNQESLEQLRNELEQVLQRERDFKNQCKITKQQVYRNNRNFISLLFYSVTSIMRCFFFCSFLMNEIGGVVHFTVRYFPDFEM